jgi:hypothetical protein
MTNSEQPIAAFGDSQPHHNIQKTTDGQYIGWRASDGAPYTIIPNARGARWSAYRDTATTKLEAGDVLTATTLRGISDRLAQS